MTGLVTRWRELAAENRLLAAEWSSFPNRFRELAETCEAHADAAAFRVERNIRWEDDDGDA